MYYPQLVHTRARQLSVPEISPQSASQVSEDNYQTRSSAHSQALTRVLRVNRPRQSALYSRYAMDGQELARSAHVRCSAWFDVGGWSRSRAHLTQGSASTHDSEIEGICGR